MAWNKTASILGTGDTNDAVAREADTIFTATFIGMVIDRGRQAYRVDMEPDMDLPTQDARSTADRAAMLKLNDVCAKVNHVVRAYDRHLEEERGLQWGLTPEFNRGGMIAGGEDSLKAYGEYTQKFLASAWNYLTQDKDGNSQSIYIGRGAYCGLVVDGDDNAIAAMSTMRTTLAAQNGDKLPIDPGDRWLPPQSSATFKARQQTDAKFAWGMIGNSALQGDLRQQGVKFVPQQGDPDPANDLVGYTHGMIRAIYECKRIGGGRPYEMSLGTATAKLASCMSCSLFMVANGYAPSASHLGKGESWLPLYHTDQHVFSFKPNASPGKTNEQSLADAIRAANDQWAAKMRVWMWTGVQAMKAVPGWIEKNHMASLEALDVKLSRLGHSPSDQLVSANLYLDAMTYHASDAGRLDATLQFGPDPRPGCGPDKTEPTHAQSDWLVQDWRTHPWMTGGGTYQDRAWRSFRNPFTDQFIQQFRTLPPKLSKGT